MEYEATGVFMPWLDEPLGCLDTIDIGLFIAQLQSVLQADGRLLFLSARLLQEMLPFILPIRRICNQNFELGMLFV